MGETFSMPILGERDARGRRLERASRFVWPVTAAHRWQADRNHGQTLERLRERGGLCWSELRWVLKGIKWNGDKISEQEAKTECLALFPQETAP